MLVEFSEKEYVLTALCRPPNGVIAPGTRFADRCVRAFGCPRGQVRSPSRSGPGRRRPPTIEADIMQRCGSTLCGSPRTQGSGDGHARHATLGIRPGFGRRSSPPPCPRPPQVHLTSTGNSVSGFASRTAGSRQRPTIATRSSRRGGRRDRHIGSLEVLELVDPMHCSIRRFGFALLAGALLTAPEQRHAMGNAISTSRSEAGRHT